MKVSLKNIAEVLNLSKTTVSWVLSGRGDEKGISAATQKRVIDCAHELNYQPNLLARSLNTGTSGTIGLILPSISDTFYSQVARAVEMEAEEHGYSLMISSSESEIEREERMIRVLKAKQVDGIILAPTKISKVEIKRLIEESYPFVIFDRYFPEMKTNYIIIDNEQSSRKLVAHLVERGKRRIAVITTNAHLHTMNLRREGYAQALLKAGLSVDFDLYGEVPFVDYEKRIFEVLDRIFAKVPDVDGFFFTTHILALEAFRYFHERGIDINEGYGLACMHEVPAMSVLAPKMNIAQMPVGEIGKNAVRILLNEINSKKMRTFGDSPQMESIMLPCTISFRD